ncbi:DUF596 domain-containing protein [Uruburuella suis]|uniref:DUF596 domain-containing protein n=1 Tax=Uruburuella suis TaxID=252130 RepID=UPI002491F769|nr:DUF596 domain-containing protein [Uruburuella suis]
MNISPKNKENCAYLIRLESDIEKALDNSGVSLDILWLVIEDFSDTYEEQTEAFFILFKEMLRRGHLKLQRDGEIIEHSPEEWEKIFRAVWPSSDMPYGAYEGDIVIWFTDDPCPAYAVWVDPEDGSLYWAG